MTTYVWDGAMLRPENVTGDLRVADSWRQVDGRVRGFEFHRARFVRSVWAETGGTIDAGPFLGAAIATVPRSGEWFPRVRLVGARLAVDVRPGPPRRPTVTVRVLPPGDPRRRPQVKGPDLVATGALIEQARGHGADEVLVRDDSGRVLESGYAALVWWEGDDLCGPSFDLPVLPSVTRRIVEARARDLGVRVRQVEVPVDVLDGREAWLLNAYQGLRVVTGWQGAAVTAGPARLAPQWRAWLDEVCPSAVPRVLP